MILINIHTYLPDEIKKVEKIAIEEDQLLKIEKIVLI